MPAAMIHLLAADCVCTDAGLHGEACPDRDAFLLGSIAPDAVTERSAKDALHLRDLDGGARTAALRALRDRLDLTRPYARGFLLHLYTDCRWDAAVLAPYRAAHAGEDWFPRYRRESHAAGYGLFHSLPLGEAAFADCLRFPYGALSEAERALLPLSAEEVAAFCRRVYEKHRDSDPASASAAFPQERLLAFAADTAAAFRSFAGEAGR